MPLQLHSFIGLFLLMMLCWLTGSRSAVSRRVVVGGVLMQFVIALVLLRVPQSQDLFIVLNSMMHALEHATLQGTSLVFGYLGGGEAPFTATRPQHVFILAFRALPLVLVISALSALLFHWRILPLIVRGFSWLLNKSLGISGPLGVGATANIFLGMVESPLLIRPYLRNLHRGELFAVMVCGMATVAGTVMVLYASILTPVIPNALGHVMTASLISAPAALTLAALYHPWPAGQSDLPALPGEYDSAMDAVTTGTARGLQLLLNIIAMLVVLVALVALTNLMLGLLPEAGGQAVSLQRLFGWLFAPLAWLMGMPWSEALVAGQFLGTKVVLNELVAFLDLAAQENIALSERSHLLLTYALCGFANFGSLGIMIGGLATLVPERKREIVALGLPSVWVGLLTTLATGAVVGVIV
ncbi:MAG: nucleoside:proton symporter [Gammaproteobacteria bacterium BRH_c0]|nr:MAG: nucleoside:proton symporter [Gammaproteobacteria bacterium BRH_c0]